MTKAFCLLKDKTILSIEGRDRVSFLQGLVTQDVTQVTPQKSLYSLLLSPQGKFLYDFFILPGNKENTKIFLIIEKDRAQEVLRRLNLYKLRAEVTLSLIESFFIFAWWGDLAEKESLPSGKGQIFYQKDIVLLKDPRLESLGGFLICVSPEKGKDFLTNLKFQERKEQDYYLTLLKEGVPNGGQDMIIDKAIPLESSMDELGAIDWEKGCYLGQELTARTRYRGEVRKRVLPGILKGINEVPFKTRLCKEEKEIGTMRSSREGYGLALIRLEAIENGENIFSLYAPQEEGEDKVVGNALGYFQLYVPPWIKL